MKLISSRLLFNVFLALFAIAILGVSVRGIVGNPSAEQLNSISWKENGPFELSPERGRFALLYSMIEHGSFVFPHAIGKFAEPDVAVSHGKYVSLFAPLVSFITIPGYVIGRYFGASQVGTYLVIALFGLLNLFLIRKIGILLGANKWAATASGFIFLFGTPAFAYAVNLYQHHISTFLILLGIYALLRFKNVAGLLIVFFLCAAAIPLDYPNLFFMAPLGIYALFRTFSVEKVKSRLSIKISFIKLSALFIMILPILFFLWFNNASYGNPLQLAGTLQSVKDIQGTKNLEAVDAARTLATQKKQKTAVALFKTRNILNGFYLHWISPDRGIIYFTPVVLFGFVGLLLAFKKKVQMTAVLTAVIGANVLLYEMWGDPWGGWAFGSRYLIPSYAILSIFIALLLTYWRKKVWFLILFTVVAFYSIAVNTLGALTTSAMPPQVEVLSLEKITGIVQRYTYQRNWEFLVSGHSKSFVFQTFLRPYLSALQFYQIITVSLMGVVGSLIAYFAYETEKGEEHD